MLTRQFSHTPLKPAFAPHLASERPVRLPVGGPFGTGGRYVKGLVLGCVGGTAASAVWTIAISGAPTGSKLRLDYTADKVYSAETANLVSAHASVAQLQTACDAIWGAGNTLVAGTPGTSFTITFQGQLASVRIGGYLALGNSTFTAGTAPAAALTRTTPGTAGAGQYDVYTDAGTNNNPTVARCPLKYDWGSDPVGSGTVAIETGNPGLNPLAYASGFFNAADLTGLDANGVADPGWRIVEGTAITEAGAVVGLGV
ncbi:hypothetical protein [Gemmata sp.]|uniref:hypothetical protein n=1 Tax=Gemmata sp. TaxID=1914242 RepID=UPI003F6F615E